jgi:hypothetical protein
MRPKWIAMFAVCIFVSAPPAQAWEDDELQSRVADGDHHVCLKKGFKSGSARYAKCRKALARERTKAQQERDDWWVPFAMHCRQLGYARGTAAFEECRRRLHSQELQRLQQQNETACITSGTGITTPLGGSSFSIICPGSSRPLLCPGSPGCPICPGSIGCPPAAR